MAKLKRCRHCGAEIAKNAEICPNCGGLNKTPIYKRWWFIVLVILFVVGGWNRITGGGSTEAPVEEVQIEYTEVTVDELYAELDDNALNAEEKYNDAYLSITGRLANIDSDGNYIGISSLTDEWSRDVQCFIKSEEQLDVVRGLSKGDTVTVKGQVDAIGEVWGYTLNIDSIE